MVKTHYVFNIHYRTNRLTKKGRERERLLLKAAKEFGLDPGIALIDKILSNLDDLINYRDKKRLEIKIDEERIAKEKLRLKTGGV